LCPLKYNLEALSVNEVGSGLLIQDKLQGVPVNVSASLIMNLVCRHDLLEDVLLMKFHSCLVLVPTITIAIFLFFLLSLPALVLVLLLLYGSKSEKDDRRLCSHLSVHLLFLAQVIQTMPNTMTADMLTTLVLHVALHLISAD
jgi:hypothetical protein